MPDGDGLTPLLTAGGHRPVWEADRAALIEGIIAESEDESLLESYLDGEALDGDMMLADLEQAIARGAFFPVVPTAAATRLGAAELIDLMSRGFPSPQEHVMPRLSRPGGIAASEVSGELGAADPAGPVVAEVIKTTSDAYVGRVSLVRVFSGTLTPDLPVHIGGDRTGGLAGSHDVDERIGGLASPLGKTLRPIDSCYAGDICAVTKLAHAETGDTLSGAGDPYLMTSWDMPEPLLPIAIEARSKADEDKLSTALARLVAEDPTLRLELHTETGQLVLWCMGDAHADVALDRLQSRFGVSVDQQELQVALRETFSAAAPGTGRNVKQSGGHGQYAVCRIEVEPLAVGAGFEFVDRIVGGVVPRQFIPSVEKGVRAQLERGVRAGYPVVDIRVTLVDGKAHSVDSSDMAFQVAGALALRDAAAAGSVCLLEPLLEVSILVVDDHVGAVMSDLSTRRGRVMGTELSTTGSVLAAGRTLIRAEVPENRAHSLRGSAALAQSRDRQLHPSLPAPRAGAGGKGAGARRVGRSGSAARLQADVMACRPRPAPAAAGCRRAGSAAPGSGRRTGMKLVSPPQRGTMCWCRCAAIPAPAMAPRLMPTLKPCAPLATRSARIACCVKPANSAVSSGARSA